MGANAGASRRRRSGLASETALLGGAIAAASAGIGLVLALRQKRRNASVGASWDGRSGGPEVPDMPLGVPPQRRSENGFVELPGFPHSDPTQG